LRAGTNPAPSASATAEPKTKPRASIPTTFRTPSPRNGALISSIAAAKSSGFDQSGCYVTAPGSAIGFGPFAFAGASDTSTGRFPDGFNTDSNCTDFVAGTATILAAASIAGATNIKVASVGGFDVGQTISIDTGTNLETAVIAAVGSAGASTVRTATAIGATVIPVANARGFRPGQTISVGSGTNYETAVVVSTTRFRDATITVSAPLTSPHAVGSQLSGTGITLTSPLVREHASEAHVIDSASTPGAPNHYYRKPF